MKASLFCVPVHVCVVESLLHPSVHSMGSVWHGFVLPGGDEKLSVVISYDCQVLGRVPYHHPLTHWDAVLEHAPSLDRT